MGQAPESMPSQGAESLGHSVKRLCDWITVEVNKSRITNWWLIFDGFQDAKPSPEIIDFLHELMFRAHSAARQLRVILLGFDDLLPARLEADVLRENIGPVKQPDLVDFFRELFDLAGRPYTMETIVEIVDKLWSDSERQLAGEPDYKDAKRLMLLNTSAYSLARELFPSDDLT